ncbi:MAG: HDOD domain-containing protein [Gammaproteobacteria bacterium]|nr:HDOD domain-containing protein [Gammaproteobacteria bacterium]
MLSFENKLQQVTELISLPEIYLKFNRLMDDPNSNIDDFAEVIRLDANLTAKLLNVVNSAYYGFTGEISRLSTAISMLGIHQLQIMVLSISAVSAVSALNFPKDIVDFKTFWHSNLLSGTLSHLLAKQLKIRSPEDLFILGLLHEIGHLFLYSQFPEQSRQAIQLSNENELTIVNAQQQLFNYHYGEIGAKLMENWHLPERFLHSIRLQPTPEQAGEDKVERKVEISVLHIAHAYAHKQFLETDKELEQLIHPIVWDVTHLTPDLIEQTLESALTASAEMEMALLK